MQDFLEKILKKLQKNAEHHKTLTYTVRYHD